MLFCPFETNYNVHRQRYDYTSDEFYKTAILYFSKEKDTKGVLAELCAESIHYKCGRPYYFVYPCIIDMMLKLPGTSPVSDLHFPDVPFVESTFEKGRKAQALELRFPEHNNSSKMRSLLICIDNDHIGQHVVAVSNWKIPHPQSDAPFKYARGALIFTRTNEDGDLTINEASNYIGPRTTMESINFDERALLEVVRMVVCLGFLVEKDLGFLERDILARDRGKPITPAVLKRAETRKGLGWHLGSALEAVPHTRRPHWGIRHCGKGRTEPRLRPIAGSIVQRNKLTKVPTGHDEISSTADKDPNGDHAG